MSAAHKDCHHKDYYNHAHKCTAEEQWTDDRKRLSLFKKAGYEVLVVWENELKNISLLEKKLTKFNNI